jgi:heat shock protein HslJ
MEAIRGSSGEQLYRTDGTVIACPPDSQEQKFLKDLEGVVIWFFEKGTLYLDLKYDTGTMNFYRGMVQ